METKTILKGPDQQCSLLCGNFTVNLRYGTLEVIQDVIVRGVKKARSGCRAIEALCLINSQKIPAGH